MKTIIRDELGRFCGTKTVYAKGYKAFNPGFSCSPGGYFKQYKENTVFEEVGNTLCSLGTMHAANKISDTLHFYNLIRKDRLTEFAEVEALSPIKKSPNKWGTSKLKIGRKLSMQEVISLLAEETDEMFSKEQVLYSQDKLFIGNTEKGRVIFSFPNVSRVMNSGDSSEIYTRGHQSQIVNIASFAEINSFGNYTDVYSSGNFCTIRTSGMYSTVVCEGKDCEVFCTNGFCRVKGVLGTRITLTETGPDVPEFGGVRTVKTAVIDGETLQPDTFYDLFMGEFSKD